MSNFPTNKVSAGAVAGAATVLIVWATHQFWKIDIPPEAASALTTVLSFFAGWATPDATGTDSTGSA